MGGDEGGVKEPGVGVRVQDKAGRVPCIPRSLAPTSQDETVRSEDGGMVSHGKWQGRNMTGATRKLHTREERRVKIGRIGRIACTSSCQEYNGVFPGASGTGGEEPQEEELILM